MNLTTVAQGGRSFCEFSLFLLYFGQMAISKKLLLNVNISKLFEDKFFKHNFVFFCGSMVVAIFSYLYHPILGRMMDLESFGEVQALISLLTLFSVLAVFFRTIVVNIVANTQEIKEKQEIILMLQKVGFYLVLAISLLIIVFSRELKTLLNFHSFYPFISLAILLILSLFSTFRSAILQALHKFKELSKANILISAGRLIFAVILVYFGWASFGAITAIILAQLLALAYVFWKTKDSLGSLIKAKVRINGQIKKELVYGFLAFSVTLCVTFLYSADVIIMKHYFPPDQAGLYSGVATIARIIFFVTGSIAGVLFPFIKINDANKENKKILTKSLLGMAILGGIILLVFLTFPDIIIRILIGQRYLVYANILPRLSFLLFLVSIINLVFYYFLALRKYFLSIIALASPVFVLILSYFNHQTIVQVINNFILVSILILVFFLTRPLFSRLLRIKY